ncbi:NAD(P)H-quinone oxidoreductase subunit K chloroplastic, partial [Bienertia sinuspersici]
EFLILLSVVPILSLIFSGILAPSSKGPEKLSSYESVFVVFDVKTVFLYPWAMSFDILGVSKKGKNNKIETIIHSIEFPRLDQIAQNSVISTTSNDLPNWSRLPSLWSFLYGNSCCFIEFAPLIGSRFNFDRYGLVPRSSPRQADLILRAGIVTMIVAPYLVRLYEQMPEPKYEGMFSTDSYSTVRGVDQLIHVDVYLPDCPPKLEAVIDAIMKLRLKKSREIHEDRIESQQKSDVLLSITRLLSKYKSPSTSKIPTESFSNTKARHLPQNL